MCQKNRKIAVTHVASSPFGIFVTFIQMRKPKSPMATMKGAAHRSAAKDERTNVNHFMEMLLLVCRIR